MFLENCAWINQIDGDLIIASFLELLLNRKGCDKEMHYLKMALWKPRYVSWKATNL